MTTLPKIEFYNQDCFKGMKNITPKSVDLVLTDPPFNCINNDWDKELINLNLFHELLRNCCKKRGLLVACTLQPFTTHLMNAFEGCYNAMYYWKKHVVTMFLHANKKPLRQCEEVIVLKIFKSAFATTYNPQKILRDKPELKRRSANNSGTEIYRPHKRIDTVNKWIYPKNFIDFKTPWGDRFHPTQKPVDMMEFFIKTYSNEGDTILDPFAGSASTAIACLNTNRNFIGFELNPEYYQKALKRIEIAKQNVQMNLFDKNTFERI